MKKGIVMEQQSEYMIVMTRDGKFHRAEKINHADIGMEVQFRTVDERKVLHQWTQVLRNRYTRAAVVAIIFLLMVFPVFSWYGSNQAYAYMNIDINPSVELELNDQMQVIDIMPQNDEAYEIVSSLKDWKKKDASEVTFELIELSQERGYSNDANQVLIGISYLKEEVKQDYTEEIETFLMEKSANISIATFLVPKDLRRKAIEQKASVNEMVADRIKKKVTDQKAESELPVHVEDDDREIIQSFYKEDSSDEKQGEVLESDLKPVAPPVLKPEKQDAKKREPEQARSKGKDQAPGQQKKKADQGERHIEEKDSKKNIEKKDNKNSHKDNENENSKDKHSEKSTQPSPKSKEKGKDKNSGSKQEDKQNDRNKGSSSNDKEKTPQGNGNSSNGKHS
ncbi:anti-sigma factor domain-containing protein [Halobacillus sp. Nhm2S1]|uniref:anti-sigma-I factor RsgI family protein n=1 Tax=Halobacillus sp. Nhm2S1 TaxID=2866716 RepID=UPI001C737265|nr:anti-sigma factor domain-containing protein [Halobacillus sp. Nhm2S1]MBX0357274.1 hypothetical protein [Halobacillus sp. Nhm2S1]